MGKWLREQTRKAVIRTKLTGGTYNDHYKNPFPYVVFRRWDGYGELF